MTGITHNGRTPNYAFRFFGPLTPTGEAVLRAYHARFGTRRIEEVSVPIAVASGYDGVQLLA